MNTSRSFLLAAPLAALVLFGQGCLGGSAQPATGPDGGVYRTVNAGTAWAQLKNLDLGTKFGSIAAVGTVSLGLDPQDPLAMYVGTAENGLIYTLDGGASWKTINATAIGSGRINSVTVSSKDKCTVFAARANQIVKTENCNRDWAQAYYDSRPNIVFTAVAEDWFNPAVVYAGTNDGDIVSSKDGGKSWKTVYRIDATQINNIVIDPRDSRTIYAATAGQGIARSSDGGANWTLINRELQAFDNSRRVNQVVVDPSVANRIYAISKFGIVRSDDAGSTWKALSLTTPPGSIDIRALTIHPKNSNKLVYATPTSLVFSDDGGVTWTPKKLPTTRGVSFLNFDYTPDAGLLLGAPAPQQSGGLF